MPWGPDDVRDVAFRRSGLVRRGYDRRQVDAFLDRIEATLRGPVTKPVTSRDLVTVTFRRVPAGRSGYDCGQVDDFLQDVAPAIFSTGRATSASATAPEGSPGAPAQPGEPHRWLGMFSR